MFLGPNSSILGGKAGRSTFPAGTTMLFLQAAAPVGWTRVTTNDDALLRIVGTAAPGTGGSNGFVATFNAQTATGSTTLSIAQMPAHTHAVNVGGSTTGEHCAGPCIGGPGAATNTGSQGGGGSHNHTITTAIKYVDALVARKN